MSRPRNRTNGTRPTGTAVAEADHAALFEQLAAERNNVELLRESIAALELAIDDQGWQRLIAAGEQEFTRDGLRTITAACRLYGIKSPLIKRALMLRTAYIFGQGVEIAARANGKRREGEQDVNAVLQAFVDDPGNRRSVFGAEAQQRIERTIGTDGNLFLSLWTRPSTGRVQVRVLPWDEITDVISNPDDASEPWFYRRAWTHSATNPATGVSTTFEQRIALYPAVNYRPKARPTRLDGVEVRWDAPVRHVKANDLEGWRFGIPDAYAAIDWARAYKEFLEDWARLVKSLSRFAWRTTARGAAQAAGIKTRLAQMPSRDPGTGQSLDVGGTAIMPVGQVMEAIPKSGATIDAGSGRPLAMMVAAALGVPVTMLLADPGSTGARAVAETLDQPMELEMQCRQSLYTDVLRDVCEYVIREAVRAPQGPLKGTVVADGDRETVTLAGDTEATVDITWPDLTGLDPAKLVEAVTKANSTKTVPPEVTLRLLLTALGQRNVDELIDGMVDDEGVFQWPSGPPGSGGGQASAGGGADLDWGLFGGGDQGGQGDDEAPEQDPDV